MARKPRNKPRTAKSADEKFMGTEPTWENRDELSKEDLESKITTSYTWYNYFTDRKGRMKYFAQYAKQFKLPKTEISAINAVEDWRVGPAFSALCRMQVNGLKISGERKIWFDAFLKSLVSMGKDRLAEKKQEAKKETNKVVVSIQDRVREIAGEHIAEVESFVDGFFEHECKFEFNMYDWLQKKQVKPMIAGKIAEHYRTLLAEAEKLVAGGDEDLNEGYSFMSKKEKKLYLDFIRGIVEDADRFSSNQRKVRAPRKPKERSAAQIIKNVRFQKEDAALKIASVDPSKAIGAGELWVFNTKYKVLQHYVALDRGGLTFKGTTIKNFDENQSKQKKLRKPEETMKDILGGGPKAIIKRFDKLTTKEANCNGRLSEVSILLRVIR